MDVNVTVIIGKKKIIPGSWLLFPGRDSYEIKIDVSQCEYLRLYVIRGIARE